MLKSDFNGQVRGQWTLRNSSMRKTWILKFYPTSPAQPLVRRPLRKAFFNFSFHGVCEYVLMPMKSTRIKFIMSRQPRQQLTANYTELRKSLCKSC